MTAETHQVPEPVHAICSQMCKPKKSFHLGLQHWDGLHHSLVLLGLFLELVNHFLFGHQGLLSLLELLLEIFQLHSLDIDKGELTEPELAQTGARPPAALGNNQGE